MLKVLSAGLTSAVSLLGVVYALAVLALSFCALPVLVLSLIWLG